MFVYPGTVPKYPSIEQRLGSEEPAINETSQQDIVDTLEAEREYLNRIM